MPSQVAAPRQNELLRLILQHGPIARQQLVELARLAPATISRLTAELMEAGFVREIGTDASVKGAGRRPILLEVNPLGAHVAALHVGTLYLDVALVNLRGSVVGRARVYQRPDSGPTAMIDEACRALRAVAAEAHVAFPSIVAVGVGSGGFVDSAAGVLTLHPRLGWQAVPLRRLVERQLGVATVVDSNVNGMVLAEGWFGAARGASSLLLLHLGSVISCGIVQGSELHRGANASAGQIGHVVVESNGPPCSCGKRGCLDAVASDLALVRQVEAADSSTAGANGRVARLTLESIVNKALAGDPALQDLLIERAERVAKVLATLVSFYDPEVVVVAGTWALDPELQLDPIRRTLEANVFRPLRGNVQVKPTAFGVDAPLHGAAALALRMLYAPGPTAG